MLNKKNHRIIQMLFIWAPTMYALSMSSQRNNLGENCCELQNLQLFFCKIWNIFCSICNLSPSPTIPHLNWHWMTLKFSPALDFDIQSLLKAMHSWLNLDWIYPLRTKFFRYIFLGGQSSFLKQQLTIRINIWYFPAGQVIHFWTLFLFSGHTTFGLSGTDPH